MEDDATPILFEDMSPEMQAACVRAFRAHEMRVARAAQLDVMLRALGAGDAADVLRVRDLTNETDETQMRAIAEILSVARGVRADAIDLSADDGASNHSASKSGDDPNSSSQLQTMATELDGLWLDYHATDKLIVAMPTDTDRAEAAILEARQDTIVRRIHSIEDRFANSQPTNLADVSILARYAAMLAHEAAVDPEFVTVDCPKILRICEAIASHLDQAREPGARVSQL